MVMPAIIMLGLDRDDIKDCFLWAAGMGALGLFLYIGEKGMEKKRNKEETKGGKI